MSKISIRMPEDLLKQVDDRAESDEDTRSGVVREALNKHLDNPTLDSKMSDLAESINSFSVVLQVIMRHVAEDMTDEEAQELVDFMRDRDDSFANDFVEGFDRAMLLSKEESE